MGATDDEPADGGRQMARVCAEVARVFSERLGRGPTKCRASWAGRDTIVVVLDDGYSTADETLRAVGRAGAVLAGRRLLLEAVEAELSRLVADTTGRPVTA